MATARVAALTFRDRSTMIADEKRELRRVLRERRRAVGSRRLELSQDAAWRLIPEIPFESRPFVSAFLSLPEEIDTRPVLTILEALGLRVALPRMQGKNRPLAFHQWGRSDPLQAGPMGVREPSSTAPLITPDLIIVPLLGFDEEGYRIGYGGGFYDRTLRSLGERGHRPLSIGFAFECQRLDRVPREPTDEPVDFVVTDAQVYAAND